MTGRYDFDLVMLSIAVAMVASYTALDLAARIAASTGRIARWWRVAGAVGMGTGIWSMHFVGMIAFKLPIAIHYDLLITAASLGIAVLVSGLALHLVSGPQLGTARLLKGGVLMGAGISGMHYLGMAAIPMVPAVGHRPGPLALSIVIATVASVVALWLAFTLRGDTSDRPIARKAVAAVVMGLAISGMHYSGMAAAYFAPGSWCSTVTLWALPPLSASDLGYGIGLFVIGILGLMILASSLDSRLARQTADSLMTVERANRELRREIGERERVEASLREMEQFVHSTIDSLVEHICVIDANGEIIMVNRAWRRFAADNGVQPEQVSEGVNYFNVCHQTLGVDADQALIFAGGLQDVLRGRRASFTLEYPCHSPQQQRWFVVRVSPFAVEGPVRAVVAHEDITERKLAELAFAAESSRRRTIFEQAQDGIVLLDEDRSVVEANPSFARMLGCEPQSLIGQSPWDWDLIYSTRESLLARWPVVAAESGIIETQFRRVDGSSFWAEIRHSLVLWAERSLLYCVCRDITERKLAAQAIAENAVRYSTVLETLADGVIVIDQGGCIQEVNEAAQRIFGYGGGEMIGCDVSMLMVPSERDRHRDYLRSYIETGEAKILGIGREVEGRRKDGSVFQLDLSISEMRLGERRLFTGIVRDITERRAQQERVLRLTRMRAVLGGINALILRVATWEELFRETCRIAVEQGGFTVAWVGIVAGERTQPVAMAGRLAELAPLLRNPQPETPRGEPKSLAAAIRERSHQIVSDVDSECEPGRWRDALLGSECRATIDLPLLLRGRPVGTASFYGREPDIFDSEEVQLLRDLAGDVAHGMEFIERAEELSFLASYDSLTRLANRSLYVERLGRLLRATPQAGAPIAVVMLDIQNFKGVNDAFGHACGDELLKEFAERLVEAAGNRDRVARIGGDSFAAVVQESDRGPDPTQIMDDRIRGHVAKPYQVNGEEQFLGVRMGIAYFPRDGDDGEKLLRSAEAALKKAKIAGESVVVSTRGVSTSFGERLNIRTQLHQAVERRELELHYQPKLRLSDGVVIGAEALLRWNRPGVGMVSPAVFVPVLEQTDLIVEVGHWALGQALRDQRAWMRARAGFEIRVAVNLSPVQLRRRDLVRTITQALESPEGGRLGIDIEVTESMLMHDVGSSIEKLKQLRELGMGVAVDDFGTGYSSLSYLATLPIDTLKIDRSFIVKMTSNEANLSIVKGIVSLAHSLGYKLVAEGVDDPRQVKILRELGCEEIQGWLFSPAVPAADFQRLLVEGRRLQY